VSPVREVVWHDLECGVYDADLALWRMLAQEAAGPVLDVGAGTGRVTLDLARRGHAVVAFDADAVLLEALAQRGMDLPVEVVAGDARELDLPGRSFPLIIVPMQTIQLFGGSRARLRFLERAAGHLATGGSLAIAIADARESVGGDIGAGPMTWERLPLPDMTEIDGVVYSSRPVMLHDAGHCVGIERVREVIDEAGGREEETDIVYLDDVTAQRIEDEARAVGLEARPRLDIPQTDEYVGSTVVMLGA
jgi:SAM-dependent methyltransferase